MRVIAGKARSLKLKTIEGLETRPTTDRIKETLFNMINNDISGSVFVDMFSGSGGIGIEALSRGAKHCYFVEQNRAAIKCIKENLLFTKLINDSTIMECDVFSAIKRFPRDVVADVVFMDPPYDKELEKETLIKLTNTELINENTLIIIEASLNTSFDYASEYGYEIIKEKIYKTNKHVFIRRKY